ncbi:TonB-dependent receptor [Pseudocolwellia agarivorans]|uniref:TonB-dependent receptor n=1 Tax=Pseudocolwellia agarivorans TaxID=1911682 RepID=UPI00098540FF|nr:TonB-dependent receptor [Pseudocolwellia agarivorans]
MNNPCNNKSSTRKTLIASISGLAMAISGALSAAEVQNTISFNIESGSLKSALNQYMKQSGRQVVYFDEHIKNLKSQAINGDLSSQDALTKLLQGTNLVIKVDKSTGAILIKEVATTKKNKTEVNTASIEKTSAQSQLSPVNNQSTENKKLKGEQTEKITVTGSRMIGVASISPVISLTSEDFAKKGLKSVEDVIRYLPQNHSSINSGGGVDASRPGNNDGATTVNLRGLGDGATLVLVNGKRISASANDSAAGGGYTDISNIPFAAIERVEIITDGASAIYGSDAVAGVVNFILKDDYSGYSITARYENSSTDADGFSIEQTAGYSWNGGNITGSLSYKKTDPANSRKAGLSSSLDHRAQGGRFFDGASQPAHIGFRGRFLPTEAPAGTEFAILPEGDGTQIDINDIVWVSRSDVNNQEGNYFLLPSKNPGFSTSATPETEFTSAHVSFFQELGEQFELSLTGLVSKRKSQIFRDGYIASPIVPASNYYNPFGTSIRVNQYSFINEIANGDLTTPSSTIESERYNISGTLSYFLPIKDWVAELSFSTGKDKNHSEIIEIDERGDKFAEALQSGDPANAINLFGDGSVQLANLNELIYINDNGNREGTQEGYLLSLNGSIYDLPAGSAKFSVGAERRTDGIDFKNYRLNPIGGRANPELDGFVPETENTAYYAELYLPLINKKMNIPFVETFSVQLATRYDKYDYEGAFNGLPATPDEELELVSKSFSDSVNRVGLLWYPIEDLKITYSWSEGFLAPTIVELFDPVEGPDSYYPFFDPKNPSGADFVYPLTHFGGNPDLKSETSVSNTFALDYQPASIEGLRLNVVWSETKFKDVIGTFFNVFGPTSTYPFENEELFPDVVGRDADGFLTTYEAFQPVNFATKNSESIDILAEYRFDSSYGEFTVGAFATHTLTLEFVAAPGIEPFKQNGTELGPSDWQGNIYIDWFNNNWSASAKYNYSGGYTVRDETAINPDVDGYKTVDVQLSYSTKDNWKLSAGVNDLFKADIPFVDNRFGVNSSRVNFRGRTAYLVVSKDF